MSRSSIVFESYSLSAANISENLASRTTTIKTDEEHHSWVQILCELSLKIDFNAEIWGHFGILEPNNKLIKLVNTSK